MLGRVHWNGVGCIEKGGRVRWEWGECIGKGDRTALDRRKVRIFRGGGSYIGVSMSSLEGIKLKKCIGGDGGR